MRAMTVGELIAALAEFPSDTLVYVGDFPLTRITPDYDEEDIDQQVRGNVYIATVERIPIVILN